MQDGNASHLNKFVRPERHEVFINHTGEDETARNFAAYLSEEFVRQQITCFYDVRSIPAGVDWKDFIRGAVQQCDVLVAILSPSYFQRYWCMHELDLTFTFKKTVIPVYYYLKGPKELPTDKAAFLECFKGKDRVQKGEPERWWDNIRKLPQINDIRRSAYNRRDADLFVRKDISREVKRCLGYKQERIGKQTVAVSGTTLSSERPRKERKVSHGWGAQISGRKDWEDHVADVKLLSRTAIFKRACPCQLCCALETAIDDHSVREAILMGMWQKPDPDPKARDATKRAARKVLGKLFLNSWSWSVAVSYNCCRDRDPLEGFDREQEPFHTAWYDTRSGWSSGRPCKMAWHVWGILPFLAGNVLAIPLPVDALEKHELEKRSMVIHGKRYEIDSWVVQGWEKGKSSLHELAPSGAAEWLSKASSRSSAVSLASWNRMWPPIERAASGGFWKVPKDNEAALLISVLAVFSMLDQIQVKAAGYIRRLLLLNVTTYGGSKEYQHVLDAMWNRYSCGERRIMRAVDVVSSSYWGESAEWREGLKAQVYGTVMRWPQDKLVRGPAEEPDLMKALIGDKLAWCSGLKMDQGDGGSEHGGSFGRCNPWSLGHPAVNQISAYSTLLAYGFEKKSASQKVELYAAVLDKKWCCIELDPESNAYLAVRVNRLEKLVLEEVLICAIDLKRSHAFASWRIVHAAGDPSDIHDIFEETLVREANSLFHAGAGPVRHWSLRVNQAMINAIQDIAIPIVCGWTEFLDRPGVAKREPTTLLNITKKNTLKFRGT